MPLKTKKDKPEYPEPVDPKIFNRIFGRDKDGKAILDELNRIYYNRASYQSSGDALAMAYREGQRAVVAYINAKTNKEE
jgi:hypothetical protein